MVRWTCHQETQEQLILMHVPAVVNVIGILPVGASDLVQDQCKGNVVCCNGDTNSQVSDEILYNTRETGFKLTACRPVVSSRPTCLAWLSALFCRWPRIGSCAHHGQLRVRATFVKLRHSSATPGVRFGALQRHGHFVHSMTSRREVLPSFRTRGLDTVGPRSSGLLCLLFYLLRTSRSVRFILGRHELDCY